MRPEHYGRGARGRDLPCDDGSDFVGRAGEPGVAGSGASPVCVAVRARTGALEWVRVTRWRGSRHRASVAVGLTQALGPDPKPPQAARGSALACALERRRRPRSSSSLWAVRAAGAHPRAPVLGIDAACVAWWLDGDRAEARRGASRHPMQGTPVRGPRSRDDDLRIVGHSIRWLRAAAFVRVVLNSGAGGRPATRAGELSDLGLLASPSAPELGWTLVTVYGDRESLHVVAGERRCRG